MPDSLPPTGGPDSYDGWDLEGLLSGENVWLPEGMRPVARTLASLRAAPMRAELVDEAAARSAFRQIMQSGRSDPAWTSGGSGDAGTLILPARTADGGPRAATGPRHSHRRPRRHGRWQPKALVGGAVAAIVIIGGIALAGALSGAGGQPAQSVNSSGTSATARSGSTGPGSGGLEGSAKQSPASLAPSSSASGGQQSSSGSGAESERSTLCRQYWAFFAQPESSANRAAEKRTLHQLSKLAGSQWNVPRYCGGYYQWEFTPETAVADPGDDQGESGSPAPGNQQGEDQPTPHADSGNGNGNAGNGNSGNGNGNSGNGNSNAGTGGNGQSGNSSGQGNQQ